MKYSSDSLNLVRADVDTWSTIKNIASSNENAFYFCDLNDIIKKVLLWHEVMPRIQPFYAVKCNDDEYVLKLLATFGLGFHCCSTSSLEKVLSLNIKPDRIIFANSAKPKAFIQNAYENNVDLMTFDSKAELYKIKEIFPNARLVLRITYKSKAVIELGRKFGCDPEKDAPELLRIGRKLGLDVVGVSFHVGCGCKQPHAFYESIKLARMVFNTARTLGFRMTLLDIGGGFSGDPELLANFANVINAAVDQFFPEREVKIISEPGTYFVESAFSLVCNVHSVRESNDTKKTVNYYVNESIYGGFANMVLINLVRYPQPLKDHGNSEKYNSNVWGITNDSLDRINKNVLLPKLDMGEWLVYHNMGHYSLPMYSSFSGIQDPKIYRIINCDNWKFLCNSLWFKNRTKTVIFEDSDELFKHENYS